jgi:hypothetical protein
MFSRAQMRASFPGGLAHHHSTSHDVRESVNGPQIDHRNSVNGCEQAASNVTKNIGFI